MRSRSPIPSLSASRLPTFAGCACLALVLAACADDTADTSADSGVTDDTSAADGSFTPSAYPAGPYGSETGQVLADLTFQRPDGSEVSLSELRASGDNQYLFLNTAAFWCGACIEEQPEIQALHNDYGDRGLLTVVTVFEDASAYPATAEDAARWRDNHDLTFPVVADASGAFTPLYDTALAPFNMLVELSTMTIVFRGYGNQVSTIRSTLDLVLQ